MKYKSLYNYKLKGRGIVYVVENEKDRPRDNNDLLGSIVFIDGIKHTVRGVNSFGLPTIKRGEKIELLV